MADLANPTFRTRLQGYDRAQIDKLVDRVARTLAGTASRTEVVRVVDLQYFYFDVKFGGYDKTEVHSYIGDAIDAIRQRAVAA